MEDGITEEERVESLSMPCAEQVSGLDIDRTTIHLIRRSWLQACSYHL